MGMESACSDLEILRQAMSVTSPTTYSHARGPDQKVFGSRFLRQATSQSTADRDSDSDAISSPPLVPVDERGQDLVPSIVLPPRSVDLPRRPEHRDQRSRSVRTTPSPSQGADVEESISPPFETPGSKLTKLLAMRNAAQRKWESPCPGLNSESGR